MTARAIRCAGDGDGGARRRGSGEAAGEVGGGSAEARGSQATGGSAVAGRLLALGRRRGKNEERRKKKGKDVGLTCGPHVHVSFTSNCAANSALTDGSHWSGLLSNSC